MGISSFLIVTWPVAILLFTGFIFLPFPSSRLYAEPSYQVECGFRGLARGERFMPVRVLLQGDHLDRKLMIRVTGTPTVYLPVELPRNTRKQLFVYTEPSTTLLTGGFPKLEILENSRQLHEEFLITRSPAGYLLPVVGGPSLDLPGVSAPPVVPAALPTKPRGYSGVNGLFIYPTAWQAIPPVGLKALAIWVQGGGTVFLPTIAGSQTLLLAEHHPFGPIAVGSVETKNGFFSWMEHAMGFKQVEPDQVDFEDPWDVASLTPPPEPAWRVFPPAGRGGEEDVDLPTVLARQRYGKGNLYFLCFDPASLPAAHQWSRREAFLQRLFRGGSIFNREDPLLGVAPNARRMALPGTSGRTSTGWFFLFLVVYLALITPVDYWLVRRLGRPRLTWISFPVTVLIFSFLAWGLGRGRIGHTEYREITWIDTLAPPRDLALAHSIVGFYSDTNQRLSMTPTQKGAEVRRYSRDSGGQVDYDGRRSANGIVQKMHIWSDHGYRVVWPTEPLLVAAKFFRDSSGGGRLLVTGTLPRRPLFWSAEVRGNRYEFAHATARVIEGEGWEFFLQTRTRAHLDPGEWDSVGGTDITTVIGANAAEFYGEARGRAVQTAWLAAVLPGPWPALEVGERNPERFGVCVVRLPIEVVVGGE